MANVVMGQEDMQEVAFPEWAVASRKYAVELVGTLPSLFRGFVSAQRYAVNSRRQILLSGDTSSSAEMLTAIGGSRLLG